MAATPGSKICLATLAEIIDTTQLAFTPLGPDVIKAGCFTGTVTDDAETFTAYGVAPFNANEISGGGYTAGGATLGSKSWAIQSGTGKIRWNTGPISIANVSGLVRWMLHYDDTLAGNNAWYAGDFGSEYTLTAETLNVTPDTNGWFRIPA